MSTVQKTTLKRYNGTDWDPVYLANSSDISYLASGFAVDATGTGWTDKESIAAGTSVESLLVKAINNLTNVDKVKIPGLTSGDDIVALAASKLSGTVARANLPSDVGGKGVEVASEEAKAALTKSDVNIGDIVKVTGGKVYLVTGFNTTVPTYMELTDSASNIAWSRITGTPTTLAGYGITDAVNSSEKVTSATAANKGKILVLNDDGKLPASITGDAATLESHAAAYFATASDVSSLGTRMTTAEGNVTQLQTDVKNIDAGWIKTGTIDIARLPAAAIPKLYICADDTARSQLTKDDVQNGDSVKVVATGLMYFVVDDTKLGTASWEAAYVEYTAGRASAVDWSGVENKPTTLVGYGITDAVASSDVVTTATGNKILKLNADGKLPASITGDAATLESHAASYFATATDLTTLAGRVTTAEGKITTLEGTVGDSSKGLVKDVADLQGSMSTAQTDITNLKSGDAITALAASKITGTMTRAQLPADISGRLIKKADVTAMYTLTKNDVAVGDLVKLNTGDVYVVTDVENLNNANGYTQIVYGGGSMTVEWSNIQNKPTTVATSGLTDALSTNDVVTTASAANAGKLLSITAAGKLDTSITGDAATLESHAASYFATASDHTTLAGRVTTAEGNITQLQTDVKNIDAGWIKTGTIDIARLPAAAIPKLYICADETARSQLTKDDVQNGDSVKVVATGLMYFVVDDTKLGTASWEAAYVEYTAGRASAVDWSGVENKPTTLSGYGITDAVASSEKVTAATAANKGKILVLNDDGKLDCQITGDVAWSQLTDKPTSTVAQIDAAVEAATHTNRAVLDLISVETTGDVKHLLYNSNALAYKSEMDEVALGSLKVVSTLPTTASAGQLVLQSIS